MGVSNLTRGRFLRKDVVFVSTDFVPKTFLGVFLFQFPNSRSLSPYLDRN